MDQYTFYKNENGVLYGVNARVINNGFVPSAGHTLATEEEKQALLRKVLGEPEAEKIVEVEPVTELIVEEPPEPVVEELKNKTRRITNPILEKMSKMKNSVEGKEKV